MVELVVDLAANTGALRYGATGFLYGLGDEGIPDETMLAALRPQVTAQKAPGGRQHPNGDALAVAPMFVRAGGREIQIYLQDIYEQWPYENLGIEDYLARVDAMTRQVVADPHRAAYVYVPFNEPDQIWYRSDFDGFLSGWRAVYQRIRSIDPAARIAGPNFAEYRPADLRAFLTFARDNGVLPHVTTWHELGDDFCAGWDDHYGDYRAIESSLGIGPLPVNINEYGRFSGDLGVPGHLVRYVAKFEASKVDGCLAYWTTAGCLNDLVTRNNQATGGWWLYKWYGELTGHTVAVTPPSPSGPVQGLAAVDPAREQVRVILGGADGDLDVVVRGVEDTTVHAAIWGVDTSGLDPSPGPYLVREDDFAAAGGAVTIPLTGLVGTSAYHVVIAPKGTPPATGYPAAYARVDAGTTTFVVTVPADGWYRLDVAGEVAGVRVGGADLGTPAEAFLPAGISRVEVHGAGVGHLEVTATTGTVTTYQAEAAGNTLGGTAAVVSDPAAGGGRCVGGIGGGPANILRFNGVTAPTAGRYRMVVAYANGELGESAHDYNTNIVDRYADISVNGGAPRRVYFRNTLGWSNYRTTVIDVDLAAGANTITFANASSGYAPHIDLIQIAAPVAGQE